MPSLRLTALAFLSGVLVCQQFASLPVITWTWLIGPLGAALWWRSRQAPAAPHLHQAMGLLLVFALGLLWALWRAHGVLDQALPSALEGQDLRIEGRIVGLPVRNPTGWRFELAVQRLWRGDTAYASPGTVRLTWYQQGKELPPAKPLVPDQIWRMTVRLKQANGTLNPGGSDYEAWLFQHGLRALGYVRSAPVPQLLREPAVYSVAGLRTLLYQRIQAGLADTPRVGLVLALGLGYTGAISQSEWSLFRDTGTIHLLAVSGLHLSFASLLAVLLLSPIWRSRSRWLRRYPVQQAVVLPALLLAMVYALLAGFGVPVQRAWVMVAVVASGWVWCKRFSPSHSLATALLLVLLYDPLAVLSQGFWLSFGAVAVILYALRSALSSRNEEEADLPPTRPLIEIWRWLRIQLAVFCGLLPALLYYFGQVSLASIPANLYAIPLVGFLVLPLVLGGTLLTLCCPDLGLPMLRLAAYLLDSELIPALAVFADPLWMLRAPDLPLWALCAALVGVWLLFLPTAAPLAWRGVGLIWLLPLFWLDTPRLAPGSVRLTVLDVGQGLAVVLETRSHRLLYDTGPGTGEFAVANSTVLPFLRHAGLGPLDRLIVSHADHDHSGGPELIRRTWPQASVMAAEPEALALSTPPVQTCQAGQHWEWDGVRFEILYPEADRSQRLHNDSCVLKVSVGNPAISVLLPGDIEARAENRLLHNHPSALRADILVAAHHGSATSSQARFIAAVQPRYVVFTVGYRNRFGFPKPAVVQRFQAAGAIPLDTASAGAIQFELIPGQPLAAPLRWREQARRYWHRR